MSTNRISVGSFIIGPEEKKAINEVLDSGRISEGPKVAEFEKEWAKYIGTKYCVAVNSGTSALMAALYTIKQIYNPKCKKVLTHRYTFVATHNAIKAVGYKPVFKGRTEISVPVHLMGYSKFDFPQTKYMIEDACQAHGTTHLGKKLGSYGIMGCFSFYIAHNIQAGEMGAVVTNDEACYKMLKKIKAHGRVCDCLVCTRHLGTCPRPVEPDPRFTYDTFGLNFKTMEFQAALALCQIKKADEIKAKRYENVKYLNEGLKHLDLIFGLPYLDKDVSYLAYPVIIKKTNLLDRGSLRRYFESEGVETRPLFNHPNAFYIGCHQYLEKQDLDKIISVFDSFLHT